MTDTTYFDDLEAVREEIAKCMKCGNCMVVCPVYGAEKVEAAVARAKIAVAEAVLDGNLALDDPQVHDMVFNCLVCKSCMGNCMTRVNFGRIILALRAALVRKNGLPWLKKMLFASLKHPLLLDTGMRLGAAAQPLAFRGAEDGRACSPRSVLCRAGGGLGMEEDRQIPELSLRPLRDRFPERVTVADPVLKAAFFTGDSLNYFYPEAGRDLIEVLLANNVEVHIPKGQNCCGVPVLVHGDVETARTLARRNIDAMEQTGCDWLITGCGSCGGAWMHDYPELLAADSLYGPKARLWAEKTRDIATFLTEVIKLRPPKGRVERVVTYHDSCHLKKSMQVFAEPRALLQTIPGLVFKEMAAPDSCCGSGGSYVLTHFKTASAIAQKKARDIDASGAAMVVTGCPACMMQLRDATHRFGGKQEVGHAISLLAESYRREKQGTADKG